MNAKRIFLHFCKWLGLFHLTRFFQKPGLRILCYHGFAINDEYSFRPKLFICPYTFEKRLRYLSSRRFHVVGLAEGLERLSAGKLPPGATAITIDDGFFSVLRYAAPLLRSHSFPASVYVTTYYSVKEIPIFRLAVQYMFWRTSMRHLDLNGFSTPLPGPVSWLDEKEKGQAMWEIIRFAESELDEAQRTELATAIGDSLHVHYGSISRQRMLSLLSPAELRELAAAGLDIQLHTHRHRLPEDAASIQRELADNRAVLEPIAGKRLEHLCYPSGVWSRASWPSLAAAGVKSATTCDPGLNFSQTPPLALKRFLDGENISQIEFESEMCGFNDVLRAIRSVRKSVPEVTLRNERSYET